LERRRPLWIPTNAIRERTRRSGGSSSSFLRGKPLVDGRGAGVSDDHHFIEILTRRGYDFISWLLEARLPLRRSRVSAVSTSIRTRIFPRDREMARSPQAAGVAASLQSRRHPKTIAVGRSVRPDFVLGHSHYSSLPCFAARKCLRVPGGVKLFGVMDLVHSEWPKVKYYSKNLEQICALKIPQDVWIILDDGTRGREAAIRHGVPEERVRFLPTGSMSSGPSLPATEALP